MNTTTQQLMTGDHVIVNLGDIFPAVVLWASHGRVCVQQLGTRRQDEVAESQVTMRYWAVEA